QDIVFAVKQKPHETFVHDGDNPKLTLRGAQRRGGALTVKMLRNVPVLRGGDICGAQMAIVREGTPLQRSLRNGVIWW
ncbi:hypothetical protein L916_17463, partial [Phytophthora nicotianae]